MSDNEVLYPERTANLDELHGLDLVEWVHSQKLRLDDLPQDAAARLQADARIAFLVQDTRGRFVGIRGLTFAQAEIIRTPPFDLSMSDEHWMYSSFDEALQAYADWRVAGGDLSDTGELSDAWEEGEPAGWRRHMPSGRRAPEQAQKQEEQEE